MRSCLIIIIFLLSFGISSISKASLDIDISEPTLEITTGFTGDTLTLFGTATPKGDIVILLKGPEHNTIIRRKIDVFGLWLNGDSVEFTDVPGYYKVASTQDILKIADDNTRKSYGMGVDAIQFKTDEDKTILPEKKSRFLEALIHEKQLNGLYSLTPNAIEFINQSLFKTQIYMPSNVPLGTYEIEAFLIKNGQIIDKKSRPFNVTQGGLAGDVHNFSYESPFLYGLTVILIALFSSMLAVLLLRRE
jgi:uncharacterized protein (TIGR02186 family)